jgi:hypothetical protein
MFGNDRLRTRQAGLQAADFVPISWLFAIEVAQTHLNSKEAIAETLQRSRDDTFDPPYQLIVAAEVVVAIDQDLHSSISQGISHLIYRK